jgi:predicted transposase YbfD/YdcC
MKKEQNQRRLMDYFSTIEDPRVERTRKHELSDILSIAICAIICGADGWTQVEEFAQCKEEWFKSFLSLPNGIPSHDTFGRVFSSLKPDSFEQCFLEWVNALAQKSEGRLIAIDGKTMRRSVDYASEKAAVHMVNAWCDTNKMVIGQIATETKSNEITAIPKLLELIDLDDAVVTTDAMGCQKEIAKAVIENDGDYILQLKANQTGLHKNAVTLFDECIDDNVYNIQYTVASETDGGHGRVEERTLWAVSNVGFLNSEKKNWVGLKSLICVEAKRSIGDETSVEKRYYISSLTCKNPQNLLKYIRGHWGVENSLHWCLDISFADDERRIRKGYGAENFARLSRIALNLLKQQTKHKVGIKTRRLCCGWNEQYLYRVLTQQNKGL